MVVVGSSPAHPAMGLQHMGRMLMNEHGPSAAYDFARLGQMNMVVAMEFLRT